MLTYLERTAGDAGRTDGWWQAREKASIASTQFTADASITSTPALPPTTLSVSNFTYVNHQIPLYTYRNTHSYFLRTPDGNSNSGGYSSTGYQSLNRLRSGQISNLTTVDTWTTYTSYNNFLDTLGAIFKEELRGIRNGTFHVQDEDRNINTGDHGDHIAASLVVQDARRRAGLGCTGVYRYLDYVTSSRTPNIITSATSASSGYGSLIAKAGVWAALSWTLGENGYKMDFDGSPAGSLSHNAWIARQYITSGSRKWEPSGNCNVV
ncbi:hypothetical protein HK097_000505 [Rhizophlyctis rosea]|uniref:Uncharacterized protein n=1 Tax=Rhizophlyctis rosea TaxID=64517 RepID=A0AAD5X713_9FUNG|nr:hypothetical protein HK097_000505 [Rhizophlyctis rosea]